MYQKQPNSELFRRASPLGVLCVTEGLGLGGGVEQLLVTLAPEIRKLGYSIDIVALFDEAPDLGHLLEEQGFSVHRLRLAHRLDLLTGLRKLWALRQKKRYGVIWGHLFLGNLYAVLLARMSPPAKSIITLHSEGRSPPRSLRGRLVKAFEKRILGMSTVKVAVSNAVARDYAAFFDRRPIEVVYNGAVPDEVPAPPTALERADIRSGYGASAHDFLIVTPARFIPKKGHSVLLDALGLLKCERSWRPKLVACGWGDMVLGDLRSQASALQLTDDVVFSPVLSHDRLYPLIQSADAVVLPSLREPFGIAAAEAMMLGTPVVLTRVDGFIELVGDSECALMVPPGDANALAAALLRLRSDPELGSELAKRGRRRIIENFSISTCAVQWTKIFDRLT